MIQKNKGLKTTSQQFRDDLLKVNLRTPPDIVVGLSDLGGSLNYSAFRDQLGDDPVIHQNAVADAGNVLDISSKLREFLFKRNLQTPSDIEEAIIDLSANQSETMRNLGSIGTDTTINWRSVVVDAGTVDNAAYVTRLSNLSRNKPHVVTDPSEMNNDSVGNGYNYQSLMESVGKPTIVNNFIVPNAVTISSLDNPDSESAKKLNLKINKYSPENYDYANIRENILRTVLQGTTYVTDYTATLNGFQPEDYLYRNFYNINKQASFTDVINGNVQLVPSDSPIMNIAAYMLNFNLQQRFDQNLYKETVGKISGAPPYLSEFGTTMDMLEMIKVAKDPLDNLVEKNYTITVPRNYVGKTAQFLLGLEGVVSPFDLWESVDLGGKDLTPTCFLKNEGMLALQGLNSESSDRNFPQDARVASNKKDDETLLKKTGGGQRWSLYQNLLMNKYSPKFDTNSELIGFQKKPKGNYYIGSETSPPIDFLRINEGFSIINNNTLSKEFNAGYSDTDNDIVWSSDQILSNELLNAQLDLSKYTPDSFTVQKEELMNEQFDMNLGGKRPLELSTEQNFRPCSLMDITQRLLFAGNVDSPISNIKTKFRDGNIVYAKGSAVKQVNKTTVTDSNKSSYNSYKTLDAWTDGFCRSWTKVKPFKKISNLVRYNELIRAERNSVVDNNANYNIFPSRLNVGTLYDQNMLEKDGMKDRFATKNFSAWRARKYMFSIENLAWKDSDLFNDLPTYEQGSNGGRVMWFPPYGLTFNETSKPEWTRHDFLGRPEPMYTYNNTERTANLTWLIVVDHPTILNVLVQKELSKLSDQQVDEILDSFFAGCLEYDIYELAKIWGVFSNKDIQFFREVLNGDSKFEPTIDDKSKTEINTITNAANNTPAKEDNTVDVLNAITKSILVFPHNEPASDTEDYITIANRYLNYIGGTTTQTIDGVTLDYINSLGTGYTNANYFNKEQLTLSEDISDGINFSGAINQFKSYSSKLINFIKNNPNKSITIKLSGYTSLSGNQNANTSLAERRCLSVIKYISEGLQKECKLAYDELKLTDKQNNIRVKFVIDKKLVINFDDMLNYINWSKDYYINFKMLDSSEQEVSVSDLNEEDFKSIFGSKNINGVNIDKKYFAALSYPASMARKVTIDDIVITDIEEPIKESVTVDKTPVSHDSQLKATINRRDIATRLLNKLIGESEYFEVLSKESPVVFDSLKQKLKYFSPAFHSTTPEGLNSRLTFLQQCVRSGETVLTSEGKKKKEGNTSVNMSFGKPPICVLRIGDFFNTKIVPDNLQIDYVGNNSITYDLNPEGIGVQPMIAKVTLNFKIIGGAGLREPVEQLQNALSFNYYANADIYESKSYGQTNAEERFLENFEVAYDSTELQLNKLRLDDYEKINYSPAANFSFIGEIEETYPVVTYGDPDYNSNHRVSPTVNSIQYYKMNYKSVFEELYIYYYSYAYNLLQSFKTILTGSVYDSFIPIYYARYTKTLTNNNSTISRNIYPQISDTTYDNYDFINVGYNAFKSSNTYPSCKLHLYPQVSDKIVNANTFNIKDFAGVSLPPLLDLDYVMQSLGINKELFKKYILCDEWLIFDNYTVRESFRKLPHLIKQVFRNAVLNEFEKYYQEVILNKMLSNFTNSYGEFLELYRSLLKVSVVLSGVDAGTTENDIKYLEVFPNIKPETDADFTKFFGETVEDVLNIYPDSLDFNVFADFKDINTQTNDIQRGNFNYLKAQLSDASWNSESKPYYDFTAGTWKNSSAPITVSSPFEKLNYEFLYFSNLTLKFLNENHFFSGIHDYFIEEQEMDISARTEDEKALIKRTLEVPSGYTYNKPMYSTDVAAVEGINRYEDLLFFGFINSIMNQTKLKSIQDSMNNVARNDNEKSYIKFFIEDLLFYFEGRLTLTITNIKSSIEEDNTNLISLLDLDLDTLNNISVMLQEQASTDEKNYMLKMFEVDHRFVNASGKNSVSAFSKFNSENPSFL